MRSRAWNRQEAADAADCRQFLSVVLRNGEDVPRRGRISDLARKSGLSRSFLTEVLQKKKRLTVRSVAGIANGLGLNANERKFFELLVAVESEEVRLVHGALTQSELKLQLEKLRSRILQKSKPNRFKDKLKKNLLSLDFFMVYAALGTLEGGSTVESIVKKTKLSRPVIERILNSMVTEEWAKQVDGRYFAAERVVDLDGLGENNGFLQAFSQAAAELSRRAPEYAADSGSFVFFTAIPTSQSRVQLMKQRLQSAILEVLDEFQEDDGSVIKKVTFGMH